MNTQPDTQNDNDILDLTLTRGKLGEDRTDTITLNDGSRVKLERGRVYLFKTIFDDEETFPHGTAFTFVKAQDTGRSQHVILSRAGLERNLDSWRRCDEITEVVRA